MSARLADPHVGDTPTTFPYARFSFYRPHDRRTAYTGEETNPVTGEVTKPPSLTKQEFKDQCDINNIIKSFKLTGQINHISAAAAKGRFEDMPDEIDFQTSMNVIRSATEAFAALPAKIRDRFHNEPQEFLAFVSDPENKDEAIKLGIVKKPEPKPEPSASPPPPPPRPPVTVAANPAPEPSK